MVFLIHLLTYPYQKSFLKKISFEGFHNFVCTELSRAVVHGLCMYIENPKYRECMGALNNYTWTELCHFLPPPPPAPCVDSFYNLSVDKKNIFFDPLPPHLVQVVIECPLILNQMKHSPACLSRSFARVLA
jgi:hypothetical protein